MVNFLIGFLPSYLIGGGPLAEMSSFVVYQQSSRKPYAAPLPQLFRTTKFHIALVFSFISSVFF